MIHRRRAELAIIDAEISRVEDNIVLLVRQRAHLKRRRNTLSPAVSLPPEVLSRIFEFASSPKSDLGGLGQIGHCIPGTTNLGISTGLGAVTPLFLSTVCAAWRKIAFASSQLWNSVTIHLDERHAAHQAALLEDWLKRSRRRPLWINVQEGGVTEDGEDGEDSWGVESTSTCVIDVLVLYSSQWQSVDIFLPSSWKPSLSRIRHTLSNLYSLTLRVAEGSPSLSRVDAFALAPRLRDVTLVGYSFSDITLPWSQLERIEGEYMNVAESLEMLRLCPSLLRYQFTQQCKGVLPFASNAIIHERLEYFELILDSEIELRALLGALTLPNLKELVLSLSEEQPILPHVVSLLRRSGCATSLRRLHLVGLMPEEEHLIDCLWQLPSLEALLLINPVMTGGKLTERFMGLMTPHWAGREAQEMDSDSGGTESSGMEIEGDPPRNRLFLPCLTRFEYRGSVTFSNRSLVNMLESRWQHFGSGRILEDADEYPTPPPTSRASIFTRASWIPRFEERVPETLARLSSVIFTTERLFRFIETDEMIVQHLIQDGLHLEFIRDMS
ncbi:hypothetical protein CPB83DRAFT_788401 [Crepidotus variabilis]|uniref:F-box domain-containing protein n=1 Tax=Crepidotus variabilis TaxID=179855 RepID=A0A9P6JRZ1_9AGAR|nr:hypothetical protein CPB83DRAFT_788401 [Crepidotus variabilis]